MKIIITLCIFLFQWALSAQSNTVSSGGTATGTTGSATYSVGQLDYLTLNGTTGILSQGVQQAFEIVTLSTNDIPQIQLTATVYPNPTVQNVTLSIKDFDFKNLEYQLFDVQGRIISRGKITQPQTKIEMSYIASATYFLHVTNNNQNLKTFKIFKN